MNKLSSIYCFSIHLCVLEKIIHLFDKRIFLTFPLQLIFLFSNAQNQQLPPARAKDIEIDLQNIEVKGKVPFDAPFVLTGIVPKKIEKLQLYYKSGICEIKKTFDSDEYNRTKLPIKWERKNTGLGKVDAEKFKLIFAFDQYLLPNEHYCFVIIATESSGKVLNPQYFSIYTESSLADNLKLDFGVGYAFKPHAVIGISSAHFYFTPINIDTDLGDQNVQKSRRFFLKASLFAGLSPITFYSEAKQDIKNRYSLGSLIYGIGYRSPFYGPSLSGGKFSRTFLQPMRINIGMLHFVQKDANPIVTKDRKKSAPFVSITFDYTIGSILGPLAKLIP